MSNFLKKISVAVIRLTATESGLKKIFCVLLWFMLLYMFKPFVDLGLIEWALVVLITAPFAGLFSLLIFQNDFPKK